MEHLPMWFVVAGWIVSLLLSLIVGSFLPAYFKKRGENLATHDDLDKLVRQMEATTKAAESIKAELSDATWVRQTHWGMKKEVLIAAAKCISEIHDSIGDLVSTARIAQNSDQDSWQAMLKVVQDRWIKASAALEETILLVGITCDDKTLLCFGIIKKLASDLATRTMTEEFADVDKLWDLFRLTLDKARNSIRRELGIPALATPQSSGSSVAQGPDQ